MTKKLYALLLPVLAIAAFAATTSAAQALPQWYRCHNVGAGLGKFNDGLCKEAGGTKAWEKEVLGTTKVRVYTAGELTLKTNTGITITCQVADGGFIWNESGVGHDEITFFQNYECKSAQCNPVSIVAEELPWKSVLEAGPVDKIEGVKVKVTCGTAVLVFTGTLRPKIENSSAVFTAATGELTSGAIKATVVGVDGITEAGTFNTVGAE